MFKQFVIILLVFTISSVFPYMAREYYEYKGSTKIAHKIPYRTLLLNWKEYLRNITNEFVYEIEDFGLCNFYLDDYTQNISRNFFGYEVKGLVNYTNGFMGTLQEIQIQDDMEMSWIDETTMTSYLRSKFIINDIILYFDFNAILTKTNFGGTVAIPLESIEFEMKVIKSYKTNEVTGVIYNANAKYPRNTRWYFEPSNAYTDIFNRDVKWSFYDDLQRLTNTTIKTLLNKVVQKQKYPDICLSCNEGMQLYEYKSIVKFKNKSFN